MSLSNNDIHSYPNGIGLGLANLGNTCYLNTALQVLAVIPEFNSKYPQSPLKKKDSPLLACWNELYQLLNNPNFQNPQPSPLNPTPLLHNLIQNSKNKPQFLLNRGEPQDSTEFMQFLIEEFHLLLEKPVEVQIQGVSQNHTDEMAKVCYEMLSKQYQKSYSEILRLCYGVTVSTLYPLPSLTTVSESTLTPLSIRPETFFILDLPLPPCPPAIPGNPVPLESCIDQFVASEILDGENAWMDDAAGYKRPVRKQVSFWSFPNILVITLRRIQGNGTKDNRVVQFPLNGLHLSKYVHGYNKDKYIYNLMGVCLHHGDIGGGHYTAITRRSTTQWVHYNDHMVQPLPSYPPETPDIVIQQETEKILHNPAVYCLFYRKLDF
jgi:ubiquitin C-terminal hydrolase